MGIDKYKAAQRLGEREYSALVKEGKNPYLPVLDDLIENVNIVNRVHLGLVSIPVDKIVGTTTQNRSNAFTKSFYPLLPAGTEFCSKWWQLYDSLEEEGMRDSIIATEYMGKYYVREGNKRVSVSRCMDLLYIEADVTRYVPEKTDDPENILYYEFLDFYNKSGNVDIYFSKSGSFEKFAELVAPGVSEWDDDTKMNVNSLYTRFRKEYLAKNGVSELSLSVSDALLVYVTLMGFDDVKDKTPAQIKEDLPKVWKEFKLDTEETPIAVFTQPTKETPLRITTMFRSTKKLHIAFMHLKNKENSAWVYAHELGKTYIENDIFPGNITTQSFFDVSEEEAESTLERLCNEGYDLIFATSPQHNAACAKVALLHPGVKILNCSLNASTKHLRTYYLRTYESKFLLGIIAGAMSKTNNIAYVADYPVYGTIASINAFALGARCVNPQAQIFLSWTSAKDGDPDADIRKNNCDVVSNIDWSSPKHQTKKFGLYIDGEEPIHLAAPIWDWGKLYETIIKSIQRGSWEIEEAAIGTQSLSYWWGLSSGAVDIIVSQNVPTLTSRLVSFLKSQMIKGNFHPISGTLRFQNGDRITFDQSNMLDLINMDVLVDGIHGFIPGVADVKDESVGLTKVQGVLSDTK